ncbi:geranylgeranyl transferase type-1 subunit beta [Entomophthora muscae]|uniref:Geranylgeranyl transferase type-1 subunit beta n=1 Tax=Entomophthora muscae TaxID=34485 RepID=A0ACC2T5D6_9FUNG|nr:geranylgeranyl transferase type-1 subunit beta [Entomophthora muscae]
MSSYSDSEDSSPATPRKMNSDSLDEIEPASKPATPKFELKKHLSYFDRCLFLLPHQYSSADCTRVTFGYFCLSALDLLGNLDEAITPDMKKSYIDWIYAQQVHPSKNTEEDEYIYCGFRGSPYCGEGYNPCKGPTEKPIPYDRANLAMTYTALLSLIILGDDFSRVNRKAILGGLKALQQPDGSFVPVYGSNESDQRFTFCAFAVSYVLNNWTFFDVDLAVKYIQSSQTYEYAISQGPNQESHGGSTYCGLASLELAGRLDALSDKEETLKWCLNRQASGFHGRCNKLDDTCYSFWIGASIQILGGIDMINEKNNCNFLYSTQTKMGGFGKYPGGMPDTLHSYMGLAALSLMGQEGVKKIHPSLNISVDAYDFWKTNILPSYS